MKPNETVMKSEPRFCVTLYGRNGGLIREMFSTLCEARKFALAHVFEFGYITDDDEIIYTNIHITEEGRAVLSFNY